MSAYFEPVSKYKDANLPLPLRGMEHSAGYDFVVAEDIIIPPYDFQISNLNRVYNYWISDNHPGRMEISLEEAAKFTKQSNAKPTLVSTGMKCHLDPGTYLELSVRSSTPLKYWLIMANGVGIIDADYYNNQDNQDNEGEIFFQLINLSPFPIKLRKGDKIGQGIIKPYLTTDGDCANGVRAGGFGSTSE